MYFLIEELDLTDQDSATNLHSCTQPTRRAPTHGPYVLAPIRAFCRKANPWHCRMRRFYPSCHTQVQPPTFPPCTPLLSPITYYLRMACTRAAAVLPTSTPFRSSFITAVASRPSRSCAVSVSASALPVSVASSLAESIFTLTVAALSSSSIGF